MRSDSTRETELLQADAWRKQKYRDSLFVKLDNGPPHYKCNSFSGSESNHLFLNDGTRYTDVTLVSHADHQGDGRSFARVDLDNDGWLDIALMSTNYPRLKLLRNKLGQSCSNQRYRLKLQGSHDGDQPDPSRTNRDAIGAKVLVNYESGRTQLLHRQSGEGNAAQNSGLIWVGFAPDDPVKQVTVKWPSGQTQVVDRLSVQKINYVLESQSK